MRLEDASDMFEYSRDPEVTRYVTWNTHTSIADSAGFINFVLSRYERGESGDWGIVLKSNGKFIGTCGFVTLNLQHLCGEIGYVLSRRYWNQGLATEAVRRLIRFGFDEMGLNRIEAMHMVENLASGRVMQKAGMTYEGLLRQKVYAKGRFHDVCEYAILRQDIR